LEARIQPNGSLCLVPPAGCKAADDDPYPWASADCGATACRIDVLKDPAKPAFTVAQRARLFDAAPIVPDLGQLFDSRDVVWGYLNGLAVLPDRIVVSTLSGVFSAYGCTRPLGTNTGTVVGPAPSRADLRSFDPEMLAPIGSPVAVAPCTSLLEPDMGGGLVAAAGSDEQSGAPTLTRFAPNAQGALVATATITLGPPTYAPLDLLRLPNTRTFVALLLTETPTAAFYRLAWADLAAGTQDSFDLQTFAAAGQPFGGKAIAAVSDHGRTLIAVGDNAAGRIVLLDPFAPAGARLVDEIPTASRPDGHLDGIGYSNDRYVIIDLTSNLLWFTQRGGSRPVFANSHPMSAYPTSLSRDPGPLLAGWMTGSSSGWAAHATLVDPITPRVLPGWIPLGAGSVGRIRADANGRYFVLLPWAAEVVRLDPN
jgi:hypothetical protein